MTKKRLHVPEKIEEMKRLGYMKERIQELYDSGMSKSALISEINNAAGQPLLSKISFKTIWAQFGLISRSREEDNKLRMSKINDTQRRNYQNGSRYGNGISADEAVAHYQSDGLSLTQMYKKFGISPVILSRILKERGIEVRQQRPIEEVIAKLQEHGIDRNEMDRLYNVENLTFNEMKTTIEGRINEELSEKTLEKIRVRFGVKKTRANTIKNRGRKSREELQHNVGRLLKTPHATLQDVADYYYKNKSLTYRDLLRELNSYLEGDDERFTLRWINRWITPLLPPDRDIGTSRLEQSVIAYVRSIYSGTLVERDRTVIHPQELDIYLPELHLAVEVNGLYWHSEKFGKDKNYHKMKYEACRTAEVRLVQIWEDDWNDRREIVESLLAHIIGVDTRPSIGARKTYVEQIDKGLEEGFLNAHHIQGFVNTTLHLGLRAKSDDRLVAVISINGKEHSPCDIVRYATSENVQGGFTKLLKHFESFYHPTAEKTFSNREISEGKLYDDSGFVVDAVLPPDYTYVFGDVREHKFNFRKARFRSRPELLYKDGLTESELAELNGLNRAYDTGKVRWVRRLPERRSLENEIQELPQCSTRFKETDHEIPRQS